MITDQKTREIILEIADKLIYTLNGDTSTNQADEIVKKQTEKLLIELLGLKGSIKKTGYNCLLLRQNHSDGTPKFNAGWQFKFIED